MCMFLCTFLCNLWYKIIIIISYFVMHDNILVCYVIGIYHWYTIFKHLLSGVRVLQKFKDCWCTYSTMIIRAIIFFIYVFTRGGMCIRWRYILFDVNTCLNENVFKSYFCGMRKKGIITINILHLYQIAIIYIVVHTYILGT